VKRRARVSLSVHVAFWGIALGLCLVCAPAAGRGRVT